MFGHHYSAVTFMTSVKQFLPALLICVLVFAGTGLAQQPVDFAVAVTASVSSQPQPSITLSWPVSKGQQTVIVQRKLKSEKSFPDVAIASLDSTATSFTDTTVKEGVSYEYRLVRDIMRQVGVDSITGAPLYMRCWGFGYINSGIKVMPILRNRVLILVDSTLADKLRSELSQFQQDLIAEGWTISQKLVPRSDTFSAKDVQYIRDVISDVRTVNGDLEAVVIVGRVAVPYAGNLAPDAHPDHEGSWPADGIYGDAIGFYTDNRVNKVNPGRAELTNIPGDGKFDQSIFSGTVSIAVGRIDFYNMPEFKTAELELLKQYFTKNHNFRAGTIKDVTGGLIADNFGSYGEGFASSAWRTFQLYSGSDGVKAGKWFNELKGPQYTLWAYGCGGGTYKSAGGIGNTADFATSPVYAIHTQLFGSYFGDWDTRDNLLRASIASSPSALTCGWVGRPAWYTHHMALGETIGYSVRLSQNNQSVVGTQLGTYVPNLFFTTGGAGIASVGDRGVHIALMGDPTLKAFGGHVPGVVDVTLEPRYPHFIDIGWKPTAGVDAYVITRRVGIGPWELITPQPLTTNQFTDSLVNEGDVFYKIYPCTLRTTASGSFYDPGKPTMQSVRTTGVAGGELPHTAYSCTVAPNPATNNAAVVVNTANILHNVTVTIINELGIEVSTIRCGDLDQGVQTIELPVSNLVSGRYTICIRSAGTVQCKPMIVMH
ncbi:MAG: hypothetical protein OKBPIBMD_01251 [Chlorobi bacterium]|nr:MAG: hypothetical protein UZ06_CHB003000386 [Chlorobi bacterium OLB6]MBV6463803.1 hypothetical protein [Chlorobiota bacterium]